MTTVLRAHFFGGYYLQDATGFELDPPGTHYARLLLAYLLLHPQRHHQRAYLAGLFWPDLPEDTARRRLSQALWRVRQSWNAIDSDRESIALSSHAHCWVDAMAFETALDAAEAQAQEQERQAHLQKAVELYDGPLLQGYYEDWVLLRREHLRERFLNSLETLITLAMQNGAYEQAQVWARRLLQEDPLHEGAHRRMMRLYALSGNVKRALEHYDALVQLFAKEWNTMPAAATQELAKQLRQKLLSTSAQIIDIAPLFDPAASLPLVGREEPWQVLQQMLASLRRGQGGVIAIGGEAGIGKSRLLAELESQAQWLNLQVWSAAAKEGNYEAPYALWIDLIRPQLSALHAEELALRMDGVWLAALAELLPELRQWLPQLPALSELSGEEAQHRLHQALARLLAVSAERAPLLVLLDDLQWADIESLNALNHIWSAPRPRALTFVLAFRDDDPAVLRRFTAFLDAAPTPPTQLHLSPLSEEDSGRLIRNALALPHPTPRFEKRLYQATSGHPLFVLETLRALYEQGVLYRNASGHWSTPWDESTEDYNELPLTERLQEILFRRLERLTPAAQEVFQYVALLNRPIDLASLRQIVELPPQALLAALNELQQLRLVSVDGQSYHVGHDLLRQAAVAMLDEEELRRRHLRIAQALAHDAQTPVTELALHYSLAEAWENALEQHHRAANQARAISAYATALEHLNNCIQIAARLKLPAATQFDLLAERENILDTLGKREAQAEDLAAMSKQCPDDAKRRSLFHRRHARFLANLSRFSEAEAAAEQAIHLARAAHDIQAEHAALIALSHVLNWHGRLEDSLQPLDSALRLVRQEKDPLVLARMHTELADALVGLGRHAEASQHLETALALFREKEDRRGETDVLNLLAIIATEQGDHEKAHKLYEQEAELCQAMGFMYGEARVSLNVGNLYNLEGKPYRALQYYDAAVKLFHAIENRRGEALARLNRVSLYTEVFGIDQNTLEDVDRALAYGEEVGDRITVAQSMAIRGVCYYVQGDLEKASYWLGVGADALIESGQLWMAAQDLRAQARVYLEMDKTAEAAACLDKAESLRHELGANDPDPMILALRGQIARQQGDLASALRYSREALQQLSSGHEMAFLITFWHAGLLKLVGEETQSNQFMHRSYVLLQKKLEDLPPELRAKSLAQTPDHRRVIQAYEANKKVLSLSLPVRDAPTGRPLRPEEWTTVHWTLSHPEDEHIKGKMARRQFRLRRLLREASAQGAAPRIDDLAQALGVSTKTIKRDLAALRAAGYEVHTRGSR